VNNDSDKQDNRRLSQHRPAGGINFWGVFGASFDFVRAAVRLKATYQTRGVGMNGFSSLFTGAFGLLLAGFLLLLFVLWVLMPFAVSSIQKRTIEMLAVSRDILSELKLLNRGLASIVDEPQMIDCDKCGTANSPDALTCHNPDCGHRFNS
jgi:hypothetical protein